MSYQQQTGLTLLVSVPQAWKVILLINSHLHNDISSIICISNLLLHNKATILNSGCFIAWLLACLLACLLAYLLTYLLGVKHRTLYSGKMFNLPMQ
jgi:hypothetical protein